MGAEPGGVLHLQSFFGRKINVKTPMRSFDSSSAFAYLFASFSDLKITFFFLTRFSPSRNTIIHTAQPVAPFMMRIPDSVIPSNETSIERCKEKIETKAVAKEIFRSVTAFAEQIWRDFTSFTVASVIFVNAYTAMAIITIS